MGLFDKKQKKKESGFWSMDEIDKLDAEYNIIFGGRSNGKSTEIKRRKGLETAWFHDRHVVLLFRRNNVKATAIGNYFMDKNEESGFDLMKEVTGKDNITVKARSNELWFYEDGVKTKQLGYYLFLDEEQDYKSMTFPKVDNMIYEEFVSRDGYLIDELTKLDSIISTIFRLRKIRVWLIGNTVTRVMPFISDWGLFPITKQEAGTILSFDKEFFNGATASICTLKIAAERTVNNEKTTQSFALSRKGQKSANGEWETENYPKITTYELEECNEQYKFIVTYGGFYFIVRLYCDRKGNYFLYAVRYRGKDNINDRTRVIGDENMMNNYYTRTFIPLVQREQFVFNLIKQGRIYYPDDLTGTDFNVVVDSINRMR